MVCEEIGKEYEETKISSSLIISFLFGLGIGAIGGFLITRKKMREEKEKEIADVTSYYDGLHGVAETIMEPVEDIVDDDHPRDDLPPEEKPYVISQKEYVEDMDYSKDTVVYYEKDHILTDMFDRQMIIEDTIGAETLSHFGDDEDNTAYSRNEKLGTDFEVILEHKSFASIMGEIMED